jgi:hypothetical protein
MTRMKQVESPTLDNPCSIEGCPERRVSRGWCAKHYQRWLQLGDPLGPVRSYRGSSGPAFRRPPRLCKVDDCGRRHFGRARTLHYDRWRRQTDHK